MRTRPTQPRPNGSQWAAALVLVAASLSAAAAQPEAAAKPKPALRLGAPFADNAILQRQMPVPVWGWSTPGTKISVRFADQSKSATAGSDGKWMLKLDPLEASASPREMVVADTAGRKATLKGILVGEVWMASGQSNMQWIASKCSVGRVLMKQIAERVKAGQEKPPVVREAKVTNRFSALHPIEHADGEWCSDARNFSAIAYAFAYELYKELKVPIGILNCSFSSTSIEAWVPRVGFRDGKDEHTRGIYQRILESDPTKPEHKAAWHRFYREIEETIAENVERSRNGQPAKAISTQTPGNLRGNRDASWMFNAKLNPMIPYAIRGAIWNQGYANMGAGLTYYHNLHSLVRGWRIRWDRSDLPVYFHQFYCPGNVAESPPELGSAAEMRLGTWLARDIPNTGMASQIDIRGSVHYYNKTVPGQRLARHALKNQYGRKIVADGPMFKAYKVEDKKLIVEFDHAEGGLVVGETGTNAKGIAHPTVIENGDGQVKLFYLADENRVWHPAVMKIDGARVILTSPEVDSPRGVSYAAGGVGSLPNLYNRSLLPMTPFIYYDHTLVTSKAWPDERLKVAGVKIDPQTVGKKHEYRKMPVLSAQFRDNAVLQAGVPITIWGSATHNWGYDADGEAEIHFSFAGIEKTIPVKPGTSIVPLPPHRGAYGTEAKEWRIPLPPMRASAEPKTLKASFTIDGELVHERVAENVVGGDVWYVAAPPLSVTLNASVTSNAPVRMMWRKAKRDSSPRPSRFSVCVSTTPKTRFSSMWADARGFAAALGHRIGKKTGRPVGIIFMQTNSRKKEQGPGPGLKGWIGMEYLKQAPSLMEDYKNLATVRPGNEYYNANAMRYVAAWKEYWRAYIPEMMVTRAVPDGVSWGRYPHFKSSVTTRASQNYNVMVHCFTPASVKGIIFLCGPDMVKRDEGANYGEQLAALANCFKERFGGDGVHFFYTVPSKALAPKITRPKSIQGTSTACEINHWPTPKRGGRKVDEQDAAAVKRQLTSLIDLVVKETYD